MSFEVTSDSHSQSDLTAVFRRLADALGPDYDVIDTMDLLVQAATRFTPAVEARIVVTDVDGTLHVLGSTSERAMSKRRNSAPIRARASTASDREEWWRQTICCRTPITGRSSFPSRHDVAFALATRCRSLCAVSASGAEPVLRPSRGADRPGCGCRAGLGRVRHHRTRAASSTPRTA